MKLLKTGAIFGLINTIFIFGLIYWIGDDYA